MEISEHIAAKRYLAECVCQRLNEEILKLGFGASEILSYPRFDEASYELVKDPYTGEQNLSCYWYDDHKRQRIGRLQFNSDGTFYAEYDIAKPHPTNLKRFVEGVNAWGSAENIKAEAKFLLLPT